MSPQPDRRAVHQRAGIVTLTGPRERNEDSYLFQNGPSPASPVLAVLAVADGMGGHEDGQVASRLAVDTVNRALPSTGTDADAIRQAIEAADREIRTRAATGGGRGMGTTLTVAVVGSEQAIVGHVGDSRAYVFNAGILKQVTSDHSRVGRMLRTGVISEHEAVGHPESNVLEQALGVGASVTVDVYRVGLGPGDVLLLSTDGMHSVLSRQDIEEVFRTERSMQSVCERLAASAQERGSDDNVTVLAWQYPRSVARTATDPGSRPRIAIPPSRAAAGQNLRVQVLIVGFLVGFVFGALLRWLAR